MTYLMTEAIQALLDQGEGSGRAKHRFLERIQNAPDRGTRGKISWTREELHDYAHDGGAGFKHDHAVDLLGPLLKTAVER